MKCLGFKNTNLYVAGKGIIRTSLKIDGTKISEIEDNLNDEGLLELKDDLIVLPGLIENHTQQTLIHI